MAIQKKYYVGSRTIIDGRRSEWAKRTFQEAVEHAKRLCEENDEEQIVVKIVAIVRRQKSPIVVQKVE